MRIVLNWYLYSNHNLYIPFVSHFLAGISLPWPHLLNSGSLWSECVFTMCPKNDLNLAHITSPLPLNVDVALQCRWFSHGLIHSFNNSQSFSLATFESTFRISEKIDHELVTKMIQLDIIWEKAKSLHMLKMCTFTLPSQDRKVMSEFPILTRQYPGYY